MLMKQQLSTARKTGPTQDEWGSSTRIGYEERPAYQPRRVVPQRKGSRFLRSVGGLLVVAGMAWVTYVATSPGGLDTILKPGLPSRPVLVLGAGLLVLLFEKLLK